MATDAGKMDTLRNAQAQDFERMSPEEQVEAMNMLIVLWREPGLVPVVPRRVIPDTTNRDNSGLSSSHMHFIASSMADNGFVPRNLETGEGHDLPIVVREDGQAPLGQESLTKWRASLEKHDTFPRRQPWMEPGHKEDPFYFFGSLGNGHFFQALNLIGGESQRKFQPDPYLADKYDLKSVDPLLRDALENGVPAVVLVAETPKAHRKFISKMLNSTFEYRWHTAADGSVMATREEFREFGSFDGLAKHADAFELDEIVEARIRVEAQQRRAEVQRKKRALEEKRAAKLKLARGRRKSRL